MGRPPKPEDQRAALVVGVRFTPAERATLAALCEARGAETLSHLIRDLVREAIAQHEDARSSQHQAIEAAVARAMAAFAPRRRDLSPSVRALHVAAVARSGGSCPCCIETRIVEHGRVLGGQTPAGEFDHFFASHLPDVDCTWLICTRCHRRITESAAARRRAVPAFEAYQLRAFGAAAPLFEEAP